jgi:hypothetical protein
MKVTLRASPATPFGHLRLLLYLWLSRPIGASPRAGTDGPYWPARPFLEMFSFLLLFLPPRGGGLFYLFIFIFFPTWKKKKRIKADAHEKIPFRALQTNPIPPFIVTRITAVTLYITIYRLPLLGWKMWMSNERAKLGPGKQKINEDGKNQKIINWPMKSPH